MEELNHRELRSETATPIQYQVESLALEIEADFEIACRVWRVYEGLSRSFPAVEAKHEVMICPFGLFYSDRLSTGHWAI